MRIFGAQKIFVRVKKSFSVEKKGMVFSIIVLNDVLEDLKEGKAELEREDQTFHNFGVEPPMEVFNEFEKFITSW